MKILLVGAVDPYANKSGGTKTYILNLINHLKNGGADITLLGISYEKTIKEDGFEFIPICSGKKISSFKFFFNLLIKIYLFSITKDTIVHLQRAEDLVPFVLFYPKIPKILTVHGSQSKKETITKHGIIIGTFIEKIAEFGLKHADKIIAVNDEIKELCIKKDPDSRNKITIIPPGVDLAIFKPMEKEYLKKKYNFEKEDKIILFVGRFDKVKGLDFLIEAFKKSDYQVKNIKLVFVGDGHEKQHLKSISEHNKNIILIPTINHSKVPEIMNCADVFALCSYREGMPTVVMEAMACGIPVVSMDVGDVHKVIKDDITGYLVKERNENEFNHKLLKVIINPDKFKDNCVKAAQQYSNEKFAEKVRGIYEEIYNPD